MCLDNSTEPSPDPLEGPIQMGKHLTAVLESSVCFSSIDTMAASRRRRAGGQTFAVRPGGADEPREYSVMGERTKWWIGGGVGLAAASGVVGFALGQANGAGDKLALGSLGEWAGGLGGFLAVGVSVWFGRMEHRRAVAADERATLAEGRERAAAIERERNEKVSRARKVWFQGRVVSYATGEASARITFENASGSPMYETVVWFQHQDGRRSKAHRRAELPGGSGDTIHLSFDAEDMADANSFGHLARYKDEDGVVWLRLSDGRVKQLDDLEDGIAEKYGPPQS